VDRRRLILESADPTFVVDRSLRIVAWNAAAEGLFGYTGEEARGKRCEEILGCPPKGQLACRHAGCVEKIGQGQPPGRTQDLEVQTKDGRRIWISLTTAVLAFKRRELNLLIHLIRDNGRTKEMELFVEGILARGAKLAARVGGATLSSIDELTRREGEVLRLLAGGAGTDAIARALFISPATARNHVRHLIAKLGAHSRLEAVALASKAGLL
jgi:PAS domain S-box-containing protein